MGDTDGNISLFKIAPNMEDHDLKAIKLFKSH